MKTEVKPIWYLAGPFYQYNENVKALAKAAGVVIVDANVTTDRSNAADPDQLPTVTLVADGTPAARVEAPPAANAGALIDVAPGVQVSQADLEAKAAERLSLTPGKFKQLKKAEREAAVVAELEAMKAAAAAG